MTSPGASSPESIDRPLTHYELAIAQLLSKLAALNAEP